MSAGEASSLPYAEVDRTVESERFWSELGRGTVVMDWCTVCDTHVWPPTQRCRTCMTLVAEERMLSGRGVIYSYTIVHRAAPAMKTAAPYVLAYVALEDGPTVMANIVESRHEQIAVGAEVAFAPPTGDVTSGALRFRIT